MWSRKSRKRDLRQADGFTLVEVLVALLVLGILITIAAFSFLGQSDKAEDSEASQYLALAYKAAQVESVDAGKFAGVLPGSVTDDEERMAGAEEMAQLIENSGVLADPAEINVDVDGFNVLPGARRGQFGGAQTVSGGPKQIIVDADSTPTNLVLYNTAEILEESRIRECTLTAEGYNAAPEIACRVYKP